jgi:hypothetical protein
MSFPLAASCRKVRTAASGRRSMGSTDATTSLYPPLLSSAMASK